ncbi:GntR family transcriptional regulator, partial [Pseudomonas syringae group genomosp. 7]|uniref:GntR family transcriptional regulator n=1 Tax=Pseudomonas syringae group genomosp. 7 TaxID=251699 RepID=UPI00376F75A1
MRKSDREAFQGAVLGNEKPPAHLARTEIEEKLRNAIIYGSLPRGTPLRQQELATLYCVRRKPLRQALRKLEAKTQLR